MKIRFIKDWDVKQGDGKGPKYRVGQEVVFDGPVAETYARKYVARGLAEEVNEGAGLFVQRHAEPPAAASAAGHRSGPGAADAKSEGKPESKSR